VFPPRWRVALPMTCVVPNIADHRTRHDNPTQPLRCQSCRRGWPTPCAAQQKSPRPCDRGAVRFCYAARNRTPRFRFGLVLGGRGAVSPSGTNSDASSWCTENGTAGAACPDWCMLLGRLRSSRSGDDLPFRGPQAVLPDGACALAVALAEGDQLILSIGIRVRWAKSCYPVTCVVR